MLVHRHNEHQIEGMKEIARSLGVDGLSLGHLFVNTNNQQQIKEWLPKDKDLSCYDYSADEIKNTWNCNELWDTMVINWDGGVSPCCWVHQEENDFGNIFNASLAELWNNNAYTSSRRALIPYLEPGQKRTICTICQGHPMYLEY
jgi:radical SAM protein with 4Fe4S-binding SPASM domain